MLVLLTPPNLKESDKGWIYRYDFLNRLLEQEDPLGTIKRTERDMAGFVLNEYYVSEDSKPQAETAIRYEYDRDRNRLRTIYPDGSIERSFYNANGMEIKHVAPMDYDPELDDGPGKTFQYDEKDRLTGIIRADWQIEKALRYDLQGNIIEEQDAAGYVTYHAYDLAGNLTESQVPVKEIDGQVYYQTIRYEYDKNFNCIRQQRSPEPVLKDQRPRKWNSIYYTYDKLNRLVKVTDGKESQIAYRYDCLNQRTYERIRINEKTWKIIHYDYNRTGKLIKKREELDYRFLSPQNKKGAVWAVTTNQYDANGNCIKTCTPNGYVKTFTYDAIDRMVKKIEEDQKCGIKRIFEYRYDYAGNLIEQANRSLEDPSYRRYRYDGRHRLTHYLDEEGAVTRLFYDKNGRISKVVRPEQYMEAEDDGPGISYRYDREDRLCKILDPAGMPLEEYTYDLSGNRKTVIRGEREYEEYDYDLGGNLTAIYQGSNRKKIQTYRYDALGNMTGLTDGNGNKTRFILDEWGKITEIHHPDGGVERYTYDAAGNITSSTDANGGTITYRYNNFNQVCEIIDQEGNIEYFYYDKEGRPETHVDRSKNVETTHYNMDNHLTYQRGEDAKGRHAVTNQYLYYPDGHLKTAQGGGITYGYEYNKTGRLKRKLANDNPVLTYRYDRNGNIQEIKTGVNTPVCYRYDTMNRLEQVSEGNVIHAAYAYTKAGKLQHAVYGNQVKTSYEYQDDGQLSSLITVTDAGKVILNYDYAYDGNGNCIKKSGEQYQNEYSYDPMNRLREAFYNGEHEWYSYDRNGNRTKRVRGGREESYYYNQKNQIIRMEQDAGVISYTYDARGNLLEEAQPESRKKYAYDTLNRQSYIDTGKLIQKNRYDGEGMRYECAENDTITRFLYDRGELIRETTGKKEANYLRGNDAIAKQDNDGISYYVKDEMKSTMFLLDEAQNIRKSYRYDAFGGILEEGGSLENRLTYTGQMYDGKAAQYYLRARYYNPRIGRFLQEDTYRGDGLNLYAYCQNNPVKYYDPKVGAVVIHAFMNAKMLPMFDRLESMSAVRTL